MAGMLLPKLWALLAWIALRRGRHAAAHVGEEPDVPAPRTVYVVGEGGHIEAVRLVRDRGVAVAPDARDLDVAESVLRRWMRELTAPPATAFPGNGQMRTDLAEIAALKKEVARLRAERDFLKKAAVFFAREAT